MMLIVAWSPVALGLIVLIALLVVFRSRKPRRVRDKSSIQPYSARHSGKPIGQAQQRNAVGPEAAPVDTDMSSLWD